MSPTPEVMEQMLMELKHQFSNNYTFDEWIESQAMLQRMAYDVDPATLTGEDRATFFTWNAAALMFELAEMSNEIGWKPWGRDRSVDREKFIGEAVDLMHFLGNLLRLVDCTGFELTEAYKAKQLKNLQRQIEGYNGRAEKCSNCGRDLDRSQMAWNDTEHPDKRWCTKDCMEEELDG